MYGYEYGHCCDSMTTADLGIWGIQGKIDGFCKEMVERDYNCARTAFCSAVRFTSLRMAVEYGGGDGDGGGGG